MSPIDEIKILDDEPLGPIPVGFRHSATSDLVVPEEVSRQREVWTREEMKLLRRTEKLLRSRNLDLYVLCLDERCKEQPRVTAMRDAQGKVVMECEHKVRIGTGV